MIGGRSLNGRAGRALKGAATGLLTLALAACTPGFDFGPLTQSGPPPAPTGSTLEGVTQPTAVLGGGPVPVALLLPLSGPPALSAVGTSMADAARLAMAFIEKSPRLGENITLELRDTGGSLEGAAREARSAADSGARLILGPMRADAVMAAGAIARTRGIPLIGFSDNPAAAGPGVYLLNVLPETELRRSLGYATAHGKRAIAAVFPSTPFGQAQQQAFADVTQALGLTPVATYDFSDEADMRRIAGALASSIGRGDIDALLLPDRASAPSFARLLEAVGVSRGTILVIGSAYWSGDTRIRATPFLEGAIFPAVDPAGLAAMTPDYRAMFGTTPDPLATLAYTAVVLANARQLALADPPYSTQMLTLPGGFAGRDGVFRFHADGKSDYALVIEQVTPQGAVTIDSPQL